MDAVSRISNSVKLSLLNQINYNVNSEPWEINFGTIFVIYVSFTGHLCQINVLQKTKHVKYDSTERRGNIDVL